MSNLFLSSECARQIVEAGADSLFYDLQRADLPRRWAPNRENWRCWFTNEGRWPIDAGEMVGVIGLVDADLESSEAIEKWRESGLRLRVKRVGLIDDANAAWLARGVALEEIPAGGTGRGITTDLFCALVWRDPDVIDEAHRFLPRAEWKTVVWNDPNGVRRQVRRLSFVKYPGDYTVVDAARGGEDGNVFALVIPAPAGPTVTRIESVNLSGNTAELTCGVTATAPTRSLTADDVGKKALLFRDSDTRQWRVLF